MDNLLAIVIIVLLLLCICRDDIERFLSTKRQCNSQDGRCYKVSTKYEDQVQASEYIAHLNALSLALMRHLREKYLWNKQGSLYRHDLVLRLMLNYNPDNIVENVPIDENNTSFVENKGDVFAICIRDQKTHKFLPKHMVEFVVIHEMAHLTTISIGHEEEFWINFKILLQEAKSIGLHNPVDYKYQPINYCMLHVNYNPYFDKNIPTP